MRIRSLDLIGRTYRHVQRYRQILSVLFKYGFDDLVEILRIDHYLGPGLEKLVRQRREGLRDLTRPQRVRLALEELGPTFIKLGQALSTRPDLLPGDYFSEFQKLQDDIAPVPFSEIEKVLETELHAPSERLFAEIEREPLAAASIGQVHRARLNDGTRVVIKVQRPNIRTTIRVDLEILYQLARLLERHLKGWDIQQPTRIVEEFSRTLDKELNYSIEAAHLERFARQFEGDRTVYVPRVFHEVSSRRVLTLEYVEGVKVSDLQELRREGHDFKQIARRGADLIMKQVFVHGFFHGDPHPGNILVMPGEVICFLDFGMMGRLNRTVREDFVDLLTAVLRRDETKATQCLLRLLNWDDPPERRELERDVAELIDQYGYRRLQEIEFGTLVQQLQEMVMRHRLGMPPDLFLMMKALSTIEGVGRMLDPEFDAFKHAAPFIRRIQLDRLRPLRLIEGAMDSGSELYRLLNEIPGELRELLHQARHGDMKLEFEHRGLESLYHTLDRVSNRLAFSIVLASLVIGSSLIVVAGLPPTWHNIPVIGLGGFLLAGAMGFKLVLSIWRKGKM